MFDNKECTFLKFQEHHQQNLAPSNATIFTIIFSTNPIRNLNSTGKKGILGVPGF